MRARSASILAALLATAGCTRTRVAQVPAPALPKETAWLEIPRANSSALDPLNVWLRELTQQRLSRVPGLTWTCTKSPPGILLQTPILGVPCEEIRKAQPDSPLACLAESLLRVDRAECAGESVAPAVLQKIWLPLGSGPYLPANKEGVLRPNPDREGASALPALKPVERPSGALDIAAPRSWLKQGAATGPLAFALTAVSDDKDTLAALWALLRVSREPTDLPLFLDPLGKPPAEPGPRATPVLFKLSSSVASEPYTEACTYVGRWLLARGMARGLDPAAARVRELRCDFSWAADLVPGRSIVLNRLPLPLFAPAKGIFVLKSDEESLSPTALRAFLSGP